MARGVGSSQCGLITHADGKKEIVVAGGIFSSLSTIYDIDADAWREGPPLPNVRFWGTTVPIDNTFLVVGGANQSQRPQTVIWKYNVGDNDWDIVGDSLSTGRTHFSAFWVPSDLLCPIA